VRDFLNEEEDSCCPICERFLCASDLPHKSPMQPEESLSQDSEFFARNQHPNESVRTLGNMFESQMQIPLESMENFWEESLKKTKNFNPLDEFKETRRHLSGELNRLSTPFQSLNGDGSRNRTPFSDITPKVDPRGKKDYDVIEQETDFTGELEALQSLEGNPLNISDQYVLARYQSKNNNCVQYCRNRDLAWGFNLNKIFEQKSNMVFHRQNDTFELHRAPGDLSYLSQDSNLSSLLILQRLLEYISIYEFIY
jgi:hypothetical protein